MEGKDSLSQLEELEPGDAGQKECTLWSPYLQPQPKEAVPSLQLAVTGSSPSSICRWLLQIHTSSPGLSISVLDAHGLKTLKFPLLHGLADAVKKGM